MNTCQLDHPTSFKDSTPFSRALVASSATRRPENTVSQASSTRRRNAMSSTPTRANGLNVAAGAAPSSAQGLVHYQRANKSEGTSVAGVAGRRTRPGLVSRRRTRRVCTGALCTP